jgi:hypothetical protein
MRSGGFEADTTINLRTKRSGPGAQLDKKRFELEWVLPLEGRFHTRARPALEARSDRDSACAQQIMTGSRTQLRSGVKPMQCLH